MTSDDGLDQRIREVLGRAGADAPDEVTLASGKGSTAGHGVRFRVLMVAASLVLLLAAVVALGARNPEVRDDAASATDPTQPSSTVASTSVALTLPEGPRCLLSKVAEYDELGTMHTVVPNQQPLTASVTVDSSGPYCSGDMVLVTVTVRNQGAGVERVSPRLILAGGANKYLIEELPSFELQPNEVSVRQHAVTLPPAPPGDYWIGLYGLGDIATIALSNPPLCDGTTVRSTFTADGAMGTEYAFITVTNTSSAPCLLGRVLWVGDVSGGTEHVVPSDGAPAPGVTQPLGSRLLPPGGTAGIVAATSNGCLDGTIVEIPMGILTLHLGVGADAPITVDVNGMLQRGCGFLLSDWGAAPQ